MSDFHATVVDIRQESVLYWRVLLDSTGFSPLVATGRLIAVAPSGARIEVPVLGLVVDGQDIWHRVAKPLAAGTMVTGQLDHVAPHAG